MYRFVFSFFIIPQKKVKRNYSVISVVAFNVEFKCVFSQMMDYVIRNVSRFLGVCGCVGLVIDAVLKHRS